MHDNIPSNKPHVLNVSFTRRLNVRLYVEPRSFGISLHDNLFNEANFFGNFIILKAFASNDVIGNAVIMTSKERARFYTE